MSDVSNLDFMDLDAFSSEALGLATTEAPVTSTVRVERDVPTEFVAVFGDQIIDFTWTLHEAKITRLSQLVNKSRDQRPYNLLTGAMAGVRASLLVEGNIPVNDWIFERINSDLIESGRAPMEREAYDRQCAALRLDWEKPLGLMFHHFGSHDTKMHELFSSFVAHGAVDATDRISEEKRGNIRQVFEHPTGIDVAWMEVGQSNMDPVRNPRQQGFVSFLNAVFENTVRAFTNRVHVAKLRQSIESGNLKGDELVRANNELALARREATSWINNWGGAQKMLLPGKQVGEFIWNGRWGATNVPCGRFGLIVPEMETRTEEGISFTAQKVTVALDEATGQPKRQADGSLVKIPSFEHLNFDVWKGANESGPGVDPDATTPKVIDTTEPDEEVEPV